MKPNGTNMPDDVVTLLSELVDGSLTADDLERLRGRLAGDPEALKVYIEWMHLHAFLSMDFQHSSNLNFAPPISAGIATVRNSEAIGANRGRRRWWIGA